ncbi:hypothetical protein [Ferrimonas sp. YFM]|uniref:hypothetical protein n=1 Tax=Ferrimonas sp. YFM TaxID=3028878 RepID=UPI0025746D03|nr:hypothetical protein [Ferrimonas sp. YFM]BDY04536.1 hypothetical protein F0521_15770 [Ferrimonas sp. YFM]
MKAKPIWALMAVVAGFWCFHQGSAMPSDRLMRLLSLTSSPDAKAQQEQDQALAFQADSADQAAVSTMTAPPPVAASSQQAEALSEDSEANPAHPHFGLFRSSRTAAVPADISAPNTPSYARLIQPGAPDYDKLVAMLEPGKASLVVGDMLLIPQMVNGELLFSEYSLAEAQFIYEHPERFVDGQLAMFMADKMMGPWSENWGLAPGQGVDPVYHFCRQAGCIFRGSYETTAQAEAFVDAFRRANPGLLVDPISWEGNLVVSYLDPETAVALFDANGRPAIPEFGADGRPRHPLYDREGNPVEIMLPIPSDLANGPHPPPLPPGAHPHHPGGHDVVLPPIHLLDDLLGDEPPFLPVVPPQGQRIDSSFSADAT